MAARPRRVNFVHQRTVRLIVEEDMTLDSLTVVKSLEEFKDNVGVVPQFGGKCFDITVDTIEAATRLATSGFDHENQVKSLRVLGQKALHVSVFVPNKFPDEDLLALLKGYGMLKSPTLRCLLFEEDGFQHLENDIRVAQYTELARDLPRKLVVQGLEISFCYTGQPIQCYQCNSAEHVVKDCPRCR